MNSDASARIEAVTGGTTNPAALTVIIVFVAIVAVIVVVTISRRR